MARLPNAVSKQSPTHSTPPTLKQHGSMYWSILRLTRTEEEKKRRHFYGDTGAKFKSGSKKLTPREDNISNTITTITTDNLLMEETKKRKYRVRKLTPRECFRLMGVTDADIDKIQAAGISKSQQYKMAGNSIVVDVLFHLFRKMFVEPQNEERFIQADLFADEVKTLQPKQYNFFNKLRVVTAFSGYDSQCMGLDRLREYDSVFDYELIAWSEIDKFAIQAHNAVYPKWADRNLGDITKVKWEEVDDFDLFTYSWPCTDISAAGRQEGMTKGSGTRSSLLWECERAIETKHPRILLMENVAALVTEKFMPEFQTWLAYLRKQGYANFWQVLNAKDFGIPQNRERVFVVSILDKNTEYHFPQPFKLTKEIADIVEEHIDESFYVPKEKLAGLMLDNIEIV